MAEPPVMLAIGAREPAMCTSRLTIGFARLLVAAFLLLAGCDDGRGGGVPPDGAPALSLCSEASGCEAVAQTAMTQEPGRRSDFHFVCPSGREFLHDWDAAVDDEVSVHLVRQEADGLTVRVRNAASSSGSFTMTLGCSDRVYAGEPGHKTMIQRSPQPPQAGGR